MAKQDNIHYKKDAVTRSGKNAVYYKGVRRKSKNLEGFIALSLFILYNSLVISFLATVGIFFKTIQVSLSLLFNYNFNDGKKIR
jgi:hypothetical protein